MKLPGLVLVTLLGIVAFGSAVRILIPTSNPVRRVVELLQGLQEKLESDLKDDESNWNKYDCWAKTVIAAKTAWNAASQSRIDSLETWVKEIESGRVEFTTERADLEKQIQALYQDLQTAAAMRTKEEKDYEAARDEMQMAIAALAEANAVLSEAPSSTPSNAFSSEPMANLDSGSMANLDSMENGSMANLDSMENGSMANLEGIENGSMPTLLAERTSGMRMLTMRQNLQKALEFGRQVLGTQDAEILEHELARDDPYKWKQLNRNRVATFKNKHLFELLKRLNASFVDDLESANAAEKVAKANYEALRGSKQGMLSTAQQSVIDLVREGDARHLTKVEAEADIDARKKEVLADTGFISEVRTAHGIKEAEWDKRQVLRRKEIAAISEAISILHSDEARDLFKLSYTSQGYSLIQERQIRNHGVKAQAVVKALGSLAASSGDSRLTPLLLLARSSSRSTIGKVVEMIDALISELDSEKDQDLWRKNNCTKEIALSTQQARMTAIGVDDLTEEIVRSKTKVKELENQIEAQGEVITDTTQSLQDLTYQHGNETANFARSKLDDENAIILVQQAKAALEKMTQEVNSGTTGAAPTLVQLSKRQTQSPGSPVTREDIQAGLAPPPPPATWEDPTYTGAEREQKGIQSVLTIIEEDIQKEIAIAQNAENAAQAEFVRMKADLEATIDGAREAINLYTGDKGNEETNLVNKGTERGTKKSELEAVIAQVKTYRSDCDWYLINFDIRNNKREIEVDGLNKARAILHGATFD